MPTFADPPSSFSPRHIRVGLSVDPKSPLLVVSYLTPALAGPSTSTPGGVSSDQKAFEPLAIVDFLGIWGKMHLVGRTGAIHTLHAVTERNHVRVRALNARVQVGGTQP